MNITDEEINQMHDHNPNMVHRLALAIDEARDWDYRVWLLSNEYGYFATGVGSSEQDALDQAMDSDQLNSILMSPEDAAEREAEDDNPMYLGNASEPVHSDYLNMVEVELN